MPAGETEERPSAWTVDTLAIHLQRQLDDFRRTLQERYETQTKAVDAAFVAQQTAMQTALTAAERAVATAMLAAEKAVDKAEEAATKRFEAVNEFRGQLSDQAATFMPRSEAETLLAQLDREIRDIKTRLDRSLGETSGITKAWGYLVAAVLAVGGVITVIVALTR